MTAPVTSVESSDSDVCFMYLLMDAIDESIQVQTKMQLASSITTSQTSESFEKMISEGSDRLGELADDVAAADGDKELSKAQTEYSQAAQEEAGKETIMTSALEVTQQTTAQYSNTIQQLVQTGGAVTNIASSVAQMIERGYS